MKTIAFTKFRFVMIAISLLLLAGGLAGTLVQGGFNLGIDFNPGLNLQLGLSGADAGIENVRQALSDFDGVQVQELGDADQSRFSIRLQNNDPDADFRNFLQENTSALVAALRDASYQVEVLGEDYVEPRFAAGLALNAIILVVAAVALILIYLWIRFRFAYALSSVAALVHDVLFMILFIGTFQIEVSSATIAAVLTIMGYSLNDTIVIFDRIRENEKLMANSSFVNIINVSITRSLSRTIITSVTTLLAVTAIFIFTTGQIQSFALNMIIGVLVGTYSSIFIASPTLLALSKGERFKEKAKTVTEDSEIVETPSEPASATNVDSSAIREQIRAQRQRKKK